MVSSKSLTLRVHDHNVTLSPQLPPALKAKALGFDSFDDGPGRSLWHANAFATGHGRVTCPAKLTLGKSRRECFSSQNALDTHLPGICRSLRACDGDC